MGLKQLKEKQAERKVTGRQKAVPGKQASEAPKAPVTPRNKGIGQQRNVTAPKLSPKAKEAIAKAQTTEEVQVIIDGELPKGYTAIGKNDLGKLMKLKEDIIKYGITAFDYETDGDPDDETQDPQDHSLVGVSFAYQVGQAFYMPLAHSGYGANWGIDWFVANFLKPILEHHDVMIIAHNIQFEHQISLMYGIDMLPKTENRLIVDTMLMVKMLALKESINEGTGEVIVGLKPNTKALLADKNGMVHGLLHVDDIKSFTDTVGRIEWEEPIPGEFYKSGKKKGQPKTKKMSRSRTFGELPVDKHTVDYGCSDSDWTLALYIYLLPLMEAEDLLDTFFELNVPFSMVLGEYELTGWCANREKLEDMRLVANKALYGEQGSEEEPEEGSIMFELHNALIEITEGLADVDDDGNVIVPAGVYGMGEWRNNPVSLEIKTSKPFNWGSTQHKQWLFFRILKLDTRGLERSKATGLPGTGKDNWEKLVDGYTGNNKFMTILKEKNKFDKILSTYVNGMLPFLREDTSKLHTSLKIVSTWRLSSKKPNLQNIPRADNDPMGIRSVFEAPDYDVSADYSHLNICTRPTVLLTREALSGQMVYVNADYSQIELRVLAWFANERNMIQAFWDGHDFHSATAHDIFNLDCTIPEVKKFYKPYRYQAKSINFGLVYGLTEYGLSKDPKMGMTTAQAKQFIDKYFMKYPGVKQYANDQIAFAREHGYVQTIFGNRRPIPEINHPNKWVASKGENKAMNTPIQGSASDIIRQAMVNIQRETRKPENSFLKAVMQIHDEIQGESPIEYALEGAMLLKETMEKPIEGISDIIPIQADPAIGKVWSHALDVSFDEKGKAYVSPKKEKKEATDVTIDEIEYMLELYHIAGIDVRVS
jgi:DNA polymerase I